MFPPSLIGSLIGGKTGQATATFVMLACGGGWLMFRGYRDDLHNKLGERYAPRWSLFAAGFLLEIPIVVWIIFLVHQGWFDLRQPINFLSW